MLALEASRMGKTKGKGCSLGLLVHPKWEAARKTSFCHGGVIMGHSRAAHHVPSRISFSEGRRLEREGRGRWGGRGASSTLP